MILMDEHTKYPGKDIALQAAYALSVNAMSLLT